MHTRDEILNLDNTFETILSWAEESNQLSCSAWSFSELEDLGSNYFDLNSVIVEMRLKKAGMRLASLLNKLF